MPLIPKTGSTEFQGWAPVATCVLAPDGRIRDPSDPLLTLTGTDTAILTGEFFTLLVADSDVERFDAAWARRHDQGIPVTCQVQLRHAGGGMRTSEVVLVPAPSADEALTIAVVRDVGRYERDARLLRRVTEAANSTSETSLLFRRALADIMATMGWLSGRVLEATGTDLRAMEASDDTQEVSDASLRACISAQPEVSAWPQASPQELKGSGAGVIALPVVVDGTVAAVLEFATRTPTDEDTELTSLLAELGHQLGSVVERERVRSVLNERTDELERSNDELERFAYVASHDLQEPLRKIVGFSELLEVKYGDRFDEEGQEYLGYVVDGARRMQQLIKDLLAYSRAGRRTPDFEAVDLDAMITSTLDMLEWTLEEADAQVTVASMPVVWGDAGQLTEIVTNLVSNAVKYGPEAGATITIDAVPTEDDAAWEITVTDDGIGIDPRYDQQVFDVFRRLHSTAEYPGTGIGLAVARRFAQAHGGRIWVTPAKDGGSVFHFTVPALPEETT